ncbi:hypothetical protein D8674_020451 [Pyrus ussuriensis x Pyrus communis]|uniref:Uncharacterized protein n=1 Tax=Pyrus ussuriensis x Pyrus communis TaxID=2448454 RepID=A0A5N5HJQ9_9ROSA|nr:hypothetical protein D8674_020451 [Pyrus ussuriensis x Pyrus communis]
MLASERSSWDAGRSIIQSDLDAIRQKVSHVKKFQVEAFQQNKVDLTKMQKLYKEATIQEYSQGYPNVYKGQDHREGWNTVSLLGEIRETGLPIPSSFVT